MAPSAHLDISLGRPKVRLNYTRRFVNATLGPNGKRKMNQKSVYKVTVLCRPDLLLIRCIPPLFTRSTALLERWVKAYQIVFVLSSYSSTHFLRVREAMQYS